LLRRGHSFDDAVATYAAVRRAGFENVNVDLIYGLPNQSVAEWHVTLQRVIDLQPDHVSAYSLQVEERTAMFKWVRDGRAPAPNDDVVVEMYELAEEMLGEAGFVHYEISNWASEGRAARSRGQGVRSEARGDDYRSRHNLVYWRNGPYLGFGCGAHSSYAGQRFSNVLHPWEYIRRIDADGSAIADAEQIDRALEMGETMMLGLRLIEDGVERQRFADRFGVGLDEAYGSIVARLIDQGLLESLPDRIRLTRRGRLLGNRVFGEFLPDEA
jgi:oxygen-independent coproporphyrinogen-3 oxidase